MLSLGGAFLALVGRASGWAVAAGVAGVSGLAGAIVLASTASGAARYRPRRLTSTDWATMAIVLAAPIGLAALRAAGHGSLTWWPSPIRFPEFSLWPALCIAALGAPAALPPQPAQPSPSTTAALAS
jgi:hypothetical protein